MTIQIGWFEKAGNPTKGKINVKDENWKALLWGIKSPVEHRLFADGRWEDLKYHVCKETFSDLRHNMFEDTFSNTLFKKIFKCWTTDITPVYKDTFVLDLWENMK